MSCNPDSKCSCNFNIKTIGICDVSRLNITGINRNNLNWTEISLTEVLCLPDLQPDIESINQVSAKIIIYNTTLIETPFAYKEYTLFSFYTSVIAAAAALPGLIAALDTDVANLITPTLDTTLIGILTTLETSLTPLAAIPGVGNLITTVQGLEADLTDLINDLNTAIANVDTASDNLLAAIATEPFSPDLICNALQALTTAVTELLTLVNSIPGTVNGIITTLTNAIAAINNPLVTPIINVAVTALTTLINTTLPPLITAVTDDINSITDLLATIDCVNSTAFEIIGNAEGTCLSGRKLIINGYLNQKIMYVADAVTQPVYSVNFEIPFVAFIIVYPKFEGIQYQENIQVYNPETNASALIDGYLLNGNPDIVVDLCENFNIEKCIENIYIHALHKRSIFKNITLFFKASSIGQCTP